MFSHGNRHFRVASPPHGRLLVPLVQGRGGRPGRVCRRRQRPRGTRADGGAAQRVSQLPLGRVRDDRGHLAGEEVVDRLGGEGEEKNVVCQNVIFFLPLSLTPPSS